MKIHWELMMVAWKGITEMRRVRLALRDTNDRRIAAYLETHKDEGVLAAEWSLDESGIEPELTIKSIGLTEKGRALLRAKLVEEGVILMLPQGVQVRYSTDTRPPEICAPRGDGPPQPAHHRVTPRQPPPVLIPH